MEHNFNVDAAIKVGINAAILLNNIYFWVKRNEANDVHYYDNHYWTYNSKKAFSKLFPYMTERQIEYALNKLKDCGYIITGNYNESPYDKTLWYSITQEGLELLKDKENKKKEDNTEGKNCETDTTRLWNRTTDGVGPIPYSKQHIKTNTLSKDSVRTSNSSETFSFGFSEEKTKSKPKRKTNDEEYLDACLLIDNFTDDLKLREKLKELFRNKKDECGKKRYHFHATTCKQYLEELSEVDDKLGAVKLSIQYNNTMKVMQPNTPNSNSSESKFIHIQNNGERVEQKKFDPKKDTLSDITF